MEKRVMYVVEKFIPLSCPNPTCRTMFRKAGEDWQLFAGDIVEGKKVSLITFGYELIACMRCKNYTARVVLESYQVFDRNFANSLHSFGFTNLREIIAYGNEAKEHHMVYQLRDTSAE